MEGGSAVIEGFAGALVRALLVVVVVATPSILLPGVSTDTQQVVALIALFAAALAFVEYKSEFPTVIEFRDAPPLNRVRFIMLFATVLGLSLIERGRIEPSSITELAHAFGRLIGQAMDFPYSPVRLATLMLSEDASAEQIEAVRDAAGLAYLTSLFSLCIFVILIKAGIWPLRDRAFNVWTNLPTFNPSAGGDVVARLERDARVNIGLGFLLPFIIPFVISLNTSGLNPISMTSPQTLIWTMTTWAFLPASLFMRGIAMGRIADMIRDMRKARNPGKDRSFAPV